MSPEVRGKRRGEVLKAKISLVQSVRSTSCEAKIKGTGKKSSRDVKSFTLPQDMLLTKIENKEGSL